MTLRAEAVDRPLAMWLRDEAARRMATIDEGGDLGVSPEAMVCSDVWWLNQPQLRRCATISVGGPESNALTAYLASRLPTVFCVEQHLAVQADLTMTDLLACCWGRSGQATAEAIDAFCARHLDAFLRAALTRGG